MPNLDSKIKAHNKVLLDSAAERKPDECSATAESKRDARWAANV